MFSPATSNTRRIIALAVLTLYGTGGVLGYGLHKLWQCEHCHLDACCAADTHCHTHDGQCCSHGHTACCSPTTPVESEPSSGALANSHDDCPICAFLAQAQSPVYAVTFSTFAESVSSNIPVSEEIGPLFLPAGHLARGPPATC
ncbi:MAG: hypothetical protein MI725_02845 [Pirellulales bacterium]|nr:hypothetical protein [Pirellulales bacterium]